MVKRYLGKGVDMMARKGKSAEEGLERIYMLKLDEMLLEGKVGRSIP